MRLSRAYSTVIQRKGGGGGTPSPRIFQFNYQAMCVTSQRDAFPCKGEAPQCANYWGENEMTRFGKICAGVAVAAFAIAPVHAATKVSAVCMYESGQNGNQKISDYTIWNTASFPIPKGTVITFQTTGAPGKTFTAKAADMVMPQDTFSTGGNYPSGTCTAWWMK